VVLGSGSNTIFSDLGFRGLVIVNHLNHISLESESGLVTVESGSMTNMVVNKTISIGLAGLEYFLGIPGSIGGAVYNNSHYLTELIGDHIDSVELLTNEDAVVWKPQSYFNFSYDYSILQETHEIILTIQFKLVKKEKSALESIAHTALSRRRQTQPLELPSSGCIFKNFKDTVTQYPLIPPNITSAGALIDQAGLKGFKIGGAEISTVHANFIVNRGNAKTQDIIDLTNHINSTILKKYGIMLKKEVFFINEIGERINL
jgi:UDP-N-acetylmuramate dehydrogenase